MSRKQDFVTVTKDNRELLRDMVLDIPLDVIVDSVDEIRGTFLNNYSKKQLQKMSDAKRLGIFVTDILYRVPTNNNVDILIVGLKGSGKSTVAVYIYEIIYLFINKLLQEHPDWCEKHEMSKEEMIIDIMKEYCDANDIYYEKLKHACEVPLTYHFIVKDEIDRGSIEEGAFALKVESIEKRCRQLQINSIQVTADNRSKLYYSYHDFIIKTRAISWQNYIECDIEIPDYDDDMRRTKYICTIRFPYPSEDVFRQYQKFKKGITGDLGHHEGKKIERTRDRIQEVAEKLADDAIYANKPTKRLRAQYAYELYYEYLGLRHNCNVASDKADEILGIIGQRGRPKKEEDEPDPEPEEADMIPQFMEDLFG